MFQGVEKDANGVKRVYWNFNSKQEFLGNKPKRWISKRVLQENKARQNFRKSDISYSLIQACACAY